MTTPCRGRETGRVRKPGLRGSRLSPRQPKGSHPCHRQPNVPPTLDAITKNGKDGSNGGRALVRRVVLQLVGGLPRMGPGGDTSETSPEPAPVEEQDQEDQEPPADLNTGTRPYNEGGNLILQQAAAVGATAQPTRCPTRPRMRSRTRSGT